MRPACLLILVDQSGSMLTPWTGNGLSTKAEQLALAVNRLLGNAVLLCSKGDERIYDYFEIGIIGYGQSVGPVLHGSDERRILVPIGELARNPRRVDQVTRKVPDGGGGLVEVQLPVPIWIDPQGNGGTPMVRALDLAHRSVDAWCATHAGSFPPIVINVTDGESTDGDPRPAAERIRELGTSDGEALLFNVHLASGLRQSVSFPNSAAGLPDRNAGTMFDMSSQLPPTMADAAAALQYDVQPGAKGFLYNADATAMIEFLDIGTRAVTPGGLRELTAGPGDSE